MSAKKNTAGRRRTFLKSRTGGLSPAKRLVARTVLLPTLLLSAGYAVYFCGSRIYTKLLEVRNSQSIVTDEAGQIEIRPSAHFSEANIRESFGLKNGSNLATIDFEAKRGEILEKRPLLSNITIAKNLPRKITISVEERKPVVRVNYRKNRGERESWLVADTDGVVFDYSLNDSNMLPVIKQARPSAGKGEKISPDALLGVRLVELCGSRNISNIHLVEVDVSNDTYLTAETREYDRIKLLWSYIKENGEHDLANMRDAMEKISDIIAADLKTGHFQTFIVTGKNRVIVSPHEKEYTR